MRLGFSTNSIADVDPLVAVPQLRDLGYASLAITLDHHTIDPFAADVAARVARWRRALEAAGLGCVVETGARHLLDPAVKHEPTLVTADASARARRIDFSRRAIDVAAALGAPCVSLWSGIGRDRAPVETCCDRVAEGLATIVDHATVRGVTVALEPEPGMVIDTLARAAAIVDRLGRPERLRLTVDVGHLECMGERPYADHLVPWRGLIANVHVDDMRACRHEHLPLGSGEVDLAAAVAALAAAGYDGPLHVELPRQSHRWLETARDSAMILAPLLAGASAA
ncbi:MAG: sugar phosphate isomerase/epimerase [Planctomycetes bacterium]|nr:sugar phosphate isomerase/epimerase [Planctomycetota bacterium]